MGSVALFIYFAELFLREKLMFDEERDTLDDFIGHEVNDYHPDRSMYESKSRRHLEELGFTGMRIPFRYRRDAIMVAEKP